MASVPLATIGHNGGPSLPTLAEILQDQPLYLEGEVDTPEASKLTGTPGPSLETMRTRGGGPAFIKRGKKVTYRRRTLLEWMRRSRERSSTSDVGEAA